MSLDQKQWLVLPDLVVRKSKIECFEEAQKGTYVFTASKHHYTKTLMSDVLEKMANNGKPKDDGPFELGPQFHCKACSTVLQESANVCGMHLCPNEKCNTYGELIDVMRG